MELLAEVKENPYRKPHKVVLKRLADPPVTNWMEPAQVEGILKELFPIDSEMSQRSVLTPGDNHLPIRKDEVSKAVEGVCSKSEKAPGPDVITSYI